MKHIDRYILESLFDDAIGASDDDVRADYIAQAFPDADNMIFTKSGSTLSISPKQQGKNPLFKFEPKQMNAILSTYPDIDSLSTDADTIFSDIKFDGHIKKIECNGYMGLSRCKNVKGLTVSGSQSIQLTQMSDLKGITIESPLISADSIRLIDKDLSGAVFKSQSISITSFKKLKMNNTVLDADAVSFLFSKDSDHDKLYDECVECDLNSMQTVFALMNRVRDPYDIAKEYLPDDAFLKTDPIGIIPGCTMPSATVIRHNIPPHIRFVYYKEGAFQPKRNHPVWECAGGWHVTLD